MNGCSVEGDSYASACVKVCLPCICMVSTWGICMCLRVPARVHNQVCACVYRRCICMLAEVGNRSRWSHEEMPQCCWSVVWNNWERPCCNDFKCRKQHLLQSFAVVGQAGPHILQSCIQVCMMHACMHARICINAGKHHARRCHANAHTCLGLLLYGGCM